MADNTPPKIKLTAFLIKQGYERPDQFLATTGFESVDIRRNDTLIGTLYYRTGFKSTPTWTSIFNDEPGFDSTDIYNQHSKALHATQTHDRWICFTFGHSRHLIDDKAYERNFGLYVTLNLSDPDALRSIDKTNIGYISLNSREQATREIPFTSFEFDNEIDLLKSLTGRSSATSSNEKETYSGRDSVTIHTPVTVDLLAEIADRLHSAYISEDYTEKFPDIGNIVEERDTAIIQSLDETLVDRINSDQLDKIWLAVPDIIEWHDISGFSYRYRDPTSQRGAGPVLNDDLDIVQWKSQARVHEHISARSLHNKNIWVYWNDSRPPTRWNLYRCLNAEIDHDGVKYILNDGYWYAVDANFVETINAFYAGIPASPLQLPPFGTMKEPQYIDYAARECGLANLDRTEIMIGGGRSRVEFCDLYSPNGDIIHIKRYGGSSLLSHLFAQAVVSGRCFRHDPDFREALDGKLPPALRRPAPRDPVDPNNYVVCLGIMSHISGPLDLPFFSKVNIKSTIQSLQDLGYSVHLKKIPRGSSH